MKQIHKYPRTLHIQGSRSQPGDEDLKDVPFAKIKDRYLVIEEKMDGSNVGVSFVDGELKLQSRGHYLSGGPREKQFDLFKSWGYQHICELRELLGEQYVMYGEYMFAKHTIFYDRLPDYFMEFDILDLETQKFLSTSKRKEMLKNFPFINSVKVLKEGLFQDVEEIKNLITSSFFIGENFVSFFRKMVSSQNLNVERCEKETDLSGLMEGLYIKVEEKGEVVERYKWVRESFLTTVSDSMSHWMDRPIVKNIKI